VITTAPVETLEQRLAEAQAHLARLAQLRGERRNPKKARWAPSHTSATPAKDRNHDRRRAKGTP